MRIIGQEQIADVFGVAPKTIVEWQEQGFPVALRGSPGVPSEYESDLCITWMVQREVRKVQFESPRDRLARVQADAIEMENQVKRKTLIPAEELEPKLRSVMVYMRERLLALRSVLSARCVGRTADEIAELLEAEHVVVLTRLAAWRDAERLEDEDEERQP